MKIISRRSFIKTAAFLPVALSLPEWLYRQKDKIAFSTLGCPKWSLDQVIEFAVSHSYDGVELRGLQGQLDLTKCPEFSSVEAILATRKKFRKKRLKIVNLGSSASLHHADAAILQKNIREAKQFIDLAAKLDCPYVRVFPNNLPKEEPKEKTLERIASALKELGQYAGGKGVTVLMETHGDVVYTKDIMRVMELTNHPSVGLVWDVVNMWSITKEDPLEVYAALKPYIKHTHLKDISFDVDKIRYVLFSNGVAPVLKAIDLLRRDHFKGFYSFEWEKLWHPEIEEPAIAFADFSKKIRTHFSQTLELH